MARGWTVKGLRAGMSLRQVARRVLLVRVAEFSSYAPFIHDPARVTELHDMRIAAKRLRYTLEIFRICFPPAVEVAIERVRAMQELLGDIHDADVLIPTLEERLLELARAELAAVVEQLQAEPDEERRLTAIMAHLAPPAVGPRVGIYALLGRTIHRRRRRYADFLDLWAKLETRGFRRELEALAQAVPPAAAPPASAATAPEPEPDVAVAAVGAGALG